ncbi:Neuroblast differentiation-associated protein AHNAK [Clarias magur]|uniref:Neuroblast differentiation-associated protein AHNAK n=1 Tax=Clarias magur TaxID=1594786 RepID=A0A8J4UGM1_CLAMG|nr:Neuroblast differentiation-associated protein AHNAK [Clarias magur]
MENISVVENKEEDASSKLEPLDKCSITQCLKAESALTAINNDKDHLTRSEFSALHEMCEPAMCSPCTIHDSSTEVNEDTALAFRPKRIGCHVHVGQDTPISINDCTDKTTEISHCENDLTADMNLNHVLKSREIGMPNSEERSPGSGVIMQNENGNLSINDNSNCNRKDTTETDILDEKNLNTSSRFDLEKLKQHGPESDVFSEDANKTNTTMLTCSHSHCEESIITPVSSNLLDDALLTVTQVEQGVKNELDDSSFIHDVEKIAHFTEIRNDMAPNQDMDHATEPVEEHWGSPSCSFYYKPEINLEVNMTFEDGKKLNITKEDFEELANSLSQGPGSFSVANSIISLPNPAPTTYRTALRSRSRQQQEESKGRGLALTPALELLEKQERGWEVDKVADEGPEVVDEEEGDEFGVFMKAGDEQSWNEGSNELEKVPCEEHAGIDLRNCSVSNEPTPWMSDWTRDISIKHSEDTWTAFTQEVDSRGTEKECWFSTAVENMHLTHSSLNTVETESVGQPSGSGPHFWCEIQSGRVPETSPAVFEFKDTESSS